MAADFLKPHPEGVCVFVKLQPRASSSEIGEGVGGELKIKVTAPPVDSAANEALLKLLATALDCPRSALQLLRGRTSRHKQVLVQGMTSDAVLAKLSFANNPKR
jgi:uncharacterized protein (TIGR00251 family)